MSERSDTSMKQLSYADACALMVRKKLPTEFKQWELADSNGRTVAHATAANGYLPADFNQWSLAYRSGWTVAHEAACRECLPEHFNQWDMTDEGGWTVAHTAAQYGHLPAHFNRWALADNNGFTVAHAAAACGHLPVGFNQWGLSNNKGRSVLGCLCLNGQSDKYISRWEKKRPLCKADTDWEVFKKELPEIYHKYVVNEVMADVYDEITDEASHGVLYGALL